MANSNSEVRFLNLKRDIERYAGFNDYANVKRLIEMAMPLCRQIFDETTDFQKKEVMKENAAKLRELYSVCKKQLGEEDDFEYGASVKPRETKPQMAPGSRSATPASREGRKEGGKEGENGDEKIEYVFEGVDVKPFLHVESNEVVTFDDVKGMTEEKKLIAREFFLSDEERAFNEMIGKKPKTFILLYGVPGTGKTFFAKAISEELKRRQGGDVPFFSVVCSQLSDCHVGSSEKNIRAVFAFCKQFEHCVLFLDEFDMLAPDRKIATGDPTVVQRVTTLLQMMDGFSSSKGTLVIAATNCPYNLDGAILSRASTRIEIPLPSTEVIYDVLQAKIGKLFAPDVDSEKLAARLNGYSNRDLKNFMEILKDQLADEFSESYKQADARPVEEFRITNAMIDQAFAVIVPTTKQSDLDRIERFKLTND